MVTKVVIEVGGMRATLESGRGDWESSFKGFRRFLNEQCGPAPFENYEPDPIARRADKAKDILGARFVVYEKTKDEFRQDVVY